MGRTLAMSAATLTMVALLVIGPAPPSASATEKCGSVHVSYLPGNGEVRVKVIRGGVSCSRARKVIDYLWEHNGKEPGKWDCVGPQTSYSACEKGRNKITGVWR